MTKYLLSFLISFPMFTIANSKVLFSCKSPGQSLDISMNSQTKTMTGQLTNFSERTLAMKCEEKSYGFLCKKGDYIAKALTSSSGRRIVQLELEGDFGPYDSGYIYTIPCR